MRNFLFGFLTAVFLAVLLVVLVVVVAMKIGSAPPRVQDATTLVLELNGSLPEHTPSALPERILQRGERLTLRNMLDNIEKAAADKRVTSILVKSERPSMGWAKAEEIRGALQRFRQNGKKLYCYSVFSSLRDYYIATACEKIFMQPVGVLDVKGMRGEAMFWKGTLDKLGAQAQLAHTGPYKTMANAFTETRFTDAHREMTNWLIDSIYGDALKGIGEARGKDAVTIRALIENGPYQATEAKAAGLIDDVLYEDQVQDLIKNQNPDKKYNRISAQRYSTVTPESVGLKGRQKVAVVYAVGTIMQGDSGTDPFGDESVGSDTITKLLREIRDDSSIKAVVLRVDSPGGDALASDSMWREMTNFKGKKPVVISMSDVAASGGYYIAASGDPIVADTKTITGSIGVVNGKVNIRGLYDKLGITKDMVVRGPYALLDSEYHAYSPEEWKRVEKQTYDIYAEFKHKVATARKMKDEDVEPLAQGRVYTGEQARQKGLVDELGGLTRAVELAKEKAGIAKTERVEVVPYPRTKSLFELLMERGGSVRLSPVVPLPPAVRNLMSIRMLNDGRPMLMMPVYFEFK